MQKDISCVIPYLNIQDSIRHIQKNNLSLSQYYTLTNISSIGISMSELSLVLGVDNSTLTRNINILIKRSLLKKQQSS